VVDLVPQHILTGMVHTIKRVYAKWIKNSVPGRFQNTVIEE